MNRTIRIFSAFLAMTCLVGIDGAAATSDGSSTQALADAVAAPTESGRLSPRVQVNDPLGQGRHRRRRRSTGGRPAPDHRRERPRADEVHVPDHGDPEVGHRGHRADHRRGVRHGLARHHGAAQPDPRGREERRGLARHHPGGQGPAAVQPHRWRPGPEQPPVLHHRTRPAVPGWAPRRAGAVRLRGRPGRHGGRGPAGRLRPQRTGVRPVRPAAEPAGRSTGESTTVDGWTVH